MQSLLKNTFQNLSQLFFPLNCECCNNWLSENEEVLCLHCVAALPRTNYHHDLHNQSQQRFIGRVNIQFATSFLYFTKEGMMQHLMHRFKYRDRKNIGKHLGLLFGAELAAGGHLQDIDYIIPIPLHFSKKDRRGYNQSDVIAEGLKESINVPSFSDALIRTKDTESQTHKTRAERLENVKGVFKATNPQLLQGKQLLLIDDVLTTGSTLESAALTLLSIPGVSVSIATLGIAID